MGILKRVWIVLLLVILLLTIGCGNSKNINGYDETNVIKSIKKDGCFDDGFDYRFNNYIKSEHFEIYYNDEIDNDVEYAQKNIDGLEEKYSDIIGFFNANEKDIKTIKIRLYRDSESLHRAIEKDCGQVYSNLTGRYIKANSIYSLCTSNCLYDFTDCVILSCFGEKKLPSWLVEGTAGYLNYDRDNFINRYGEYVTFENLDFVFDKDNYMDGYEFGYSLVNTIVKNYGKDKLIELLNAYGDLKSVNIDRKDLFDKWMLYINDNKLERVYGPDETDYADIIDKSGQVNDEAGNIFNAYARNEHFELYYNKDIDNSKAYADMTLELLETKYDSFIDLFRVDKNSIPVIKIFMYHSTATYSAELKALNLPSNLMSNGVTTHSNKFLFKFREKDDEWKASAVHELNHIIGVNAVSDMYVYRWLLEGIAMYYSQKSDICGEANYQNIIKAGPFDYRGLCYNGELSYIYGYSMVEYIISKYGEDSLIDLLYNKCSIENQFNVTIEEFINDYLNYLKTK